MELIATLSVSAARKFGEIGFIIGAIGGILVILGAARADVRRADVRGIVMLAGACVTVAFALGIVAFHWGG